MVDLRGGDGEPLSWRIHNDGAGFVILTLFDGDRRFYYPAMTSGDALLMAASLHLAAFERETERMRPSDRGPAWRRL